MAHIFHLQKVPDDQRSEAGHDEDDGKAWFEATEYHQTSASKVGEGEKRSEFSSIIHEEDSAAKYDKHTTSLAGAPHLPTTVAIQAPSNPVGPNINAKSATRKNNVVKTNVSRAGIASKRARSASALSTDSSSVQYVAARPTKVAKTEDSRSRPSSSTIKTQMEVFSMQAEPVHKLEAPIAAMDPNDIVFTAESIPLYAAYFHNLLNPKKWLHETVVYASMMLTAKERNAVASHSWRATARHPPPCHPRFMVLDRDDFRNAKDGMNFISKKWGVTDFYKLDAVLVPILLKDHWTLGVIRPKIKELYVLDPLNSRTLDQQRILHSIIEKISGAAHNQNNWTAREARSERQYNTYDCGVFAIVNAELTMHGKPLALCDSTAMYAKRKEIAMRLYDHQDVPLSFRL